MKFINVFSKTLIFFCMLWFHASTAYGWTILQTHLEILKQQAVTTQNYGLKEKAAAIENVYKLLEAVKAFGNNNQKHSFEFLNTPFSSLLLSILAPSSILGAVELSQLLQTIHNPDKEKVIATANFFTQNNELRELLITQLKELDKHTQHIFLNGYMFNKWIDLAQTPPIAPSGFFKTINNTSHGVNFTNLVINAEHLGSRFINWGLSFVSPTLENTVPVWSLYPSLGLLGGVLQFCLMPKRMQLAVQEMEKTRIKKSMIDFHKSLKDFILATQIFLLSANNDTCTQLAQELNCPETFNATWQDVINITRMLHVVGQIDAALTIAHAQAKKSCIQVKFSNNDINLEQSIQKLWYISNNEQQAPRIENNQNHTYNLIFNETQDAQNRGRFFCINALLSQTLGAVVPFSRAIDDDAITISSFDVSKMYVTTGRMYSTTGITERLMSISLHLE